MRTEITAVCAGKIHHDSKRDARAAANAQRTKPGQRGRLDVYRCPYCPAGWCVGHISANALKRRNPRQRRRFAAA